MQIHQLLTDAMHGVHPAAQGVSFLLFFLLREASVYNSLVGSEEKETLHFGGSPMLNTQAMTCDFKMVQEMCRP